jgi:transposase
MAKSPARKIKALRQSGTLNVRVEHVRHSLFANSLFFDPNDFLQLKYEMLRAIQTEHVSVTQAAAEFGVSRPTVYQTQADFQARGLSGLLPQKRGPRNPHKLTAQIMEFLFKLHADEPGLSGVQLAARVKRRWRITLHARTIEKALAGRAKRGRRKP